MVTGAMVAGLAFVATAVATLFAEATFKRWRQKRRAHEAAWTGALALFALASAALATGASTGWDRGVFRVFYLLGAVLNVPWLALGTVYLLFGERAGRRVRAVLVFFSGLAVGVLLTAPMTGDVTGSATIPVGKEAFGVFPRVLAAAGSGLGALVVFGGAAWSAVRFARAKRTGGRMVVANFLIALGTLVLSGGGTLQGVLGHDEAFTLSLAAGISVIYAGFLVAARPKSVSDGRQVSGMAHLGPQPV
jgi:MFS family permease